VTAEAASVAFATAAPRAPTTLVPLTSKSPADYVDTCLADPGSLGPPGGAGRSGPETDPGATGGRCPRLRRKGANCGRHAGIPSTTEAVSSNPADSRHVRLSTNKQNESCINPSISLVALSREELRSAGAAVDRGRSWSIQQPGRLTSVRAELVGARSI
jgi:hypothetical protein